MAKVTSLITLQGTFDGVTFVKSPTYGNHIRSKRGTHKSAVLNEAYEKQNKKLVKANVPAKIIKDAIGPYRQDLYDGSLWRRLISMINEQDLEDGSFDFTELKPFDIHKNYPLRQLLNLKTSTRVDRERSELHVTLSYDMHAMFEESLPADGYRIGVIAIFPDLQNRDAKTEAMYSDIIEFTEEVVPLHVCFPVPSTAKSFLVCVRIDGCREGKPYDTLASKGMSMVGTGRI